MRKILIIARYCCMCSLSSQIFATFPASVTKFSLIFAALTVQQLRASDQQ